MAFMDYADGIIQNWFHIFSHFSSYTLFNKIKVIFAGAGIFPKSLHILHTMFKKTTIYYIVAVFWGYTLHIFI